jgi:ribulose-phosphate 3-epimerase
VWIRKNAPHAIIEVDGGMNPEAARLAKVAGADIIVSATDIFGSKNPKEGYELLKNI